MMKQGNDMKKTAITVALIIIILLISAGCSTIPKGKTEEFAFEFRYGVGARNILNTFQGKYTKDMIVDEAITIDFKLNKKQLKEVHDKMLEIGFFNYPEQFNPKNNSEVTPHQSYYFKVRTGNRIKEVYWEDKHLSSDAKAKKLRELIHLIRGIIENSFEYSTIPEPRGGYL